MRKWKVLYYETMERECFVKNFISSRNMRDRAKIAAIIEALQENGINLTRPYADYLRDNIHELRIKLSGDETRILYFFCFKENIVLTHTFIKHTDEIPEREINKAIKYRDDFLKRFNENTNKEI